MSTQNHAQVFTSFCQKPMTNWSYVRLKGPWLFYPPIVNISVDRCSTTHVQKHETQIVNVQSVLNGDYPFLSEIGPRKKIMTRINF